MVSEASCLGGCRRDHLPCYLASCSWSRQSGHPWIFQRWARLCLSSTATASCERRERFRTEQSCHLGVCPSPCSSHRITEAYCRRPGTLPCCWQSRTCSRSRYPRDHSGGLPCLEPTSADDCSAARCAALRCSFGAWGGRRGFRCRSVRGLSRRTKRRELVSSNTSSNVRSLESQHQRAACLAL